HHGTPTGKWVEPDYCFYIDHWQAISGKERIDWRLDPPPDLVLEIDVTSYSDVHDYLPYRVPEVWLFRNKELVMYQLQGLEYVVQTASRYFPDVNLPELIAQCVQVAYERNTRTAFRERNQRLGKTREGGLMVLFQTHHHASLSRWPLLPNDLTTRLQRWWEREAQRPPQQVRPFPPLLQ